MLPAVWRAGRAGSGSLRQMRDLLDGCEQADIAFANLIRKCCAGPKVGKELNSDFRGAVSSRETPLCIRSIQIAGRSVASLPDKVFKSAVSAGDSSIAGLVTI